MGLGDVIAPVPADFGFAGYCVDAAVRSSERDLDQVEGFGYDGVGVG